jgi:hypothetical protein
VRVLRSLLLDAGETPVDGEVPALFEPLTDDVSDLERGRAHHQVERHGLDPEAVVSELVTYRTIHRHLTDCRGREAPTASVITADRGVAAAEDRVEKLELRVTRVTKKTLTELRTPTTSPNPTM